jgi:FtsZ-interacting cell division protein ZipA
VRTWLVVLASVVAVALVFGGLWAAGALIVDDDSQSAGTRSTMTSSSTTRARDAAPPPCRTPLTPDEPLRLWIGGDSLAGSL